ncbi:MAG: sulfatase-like hydrolase/transferase [Anaerolineae bacterium]
MNFLFFFPDEMRAESVSSYGHPLVEMPNFDRLASEGVRFDQCHVQHSVCTPSRCSLMTGWYPHVAGHRTLWHLLRPHEPSLFRYLKEAGYHIEWYGKNDLYSEAYFDGVVDRFEDPGGRHTGANAFEVGDPGYFSFLYEPFEGGLWETGDAQRVQRGIDFLQKRAADTQPFMLYLPLSLPHPPYACPEPYHSMYSADDVPPLRPAGLPDKPDFHRLIREHRNLGEVPQEVYAKIQAVYLGCNSYVDWLLGQVLDTLEVAGLADETCVIVSADHGDWAGDYGLVEKWPSGLDDTLTRVPLVIRAPGVSPGHVVNEPIELFDTMATVLDLAGLKAEHTHFARSLVPQLRGAAGDPERVIWAEGGYDPHEPHAFEGRSNAGIFQDVNHIYYPKGLQQQEQPESVCRATMMRTMDYKLVRRPLGVSELYDLRSDPLELSNVYEDPAYDGIRRKMEQQMVDWYIHTSDVVPTDEDPRGLPPQR